MKVAPFAIAASLALALTGSVSAQDDQLGEDLYAASCGVCHGSAGLGDGEFAQYLTVRPSNLAILTSENDGVFPYLDIFQIVDGRTGVRGHGATDMPIWGAVFQREMEPIGQEYGAELLVRARIVALVDYIESLQAD